MTRHTVPLGLNPSWVRWGGKGGRWGREKGRMGDSWGPDEIKGQPEDSRGTQGLGQFLWRCFSLAWKRGETAVFWAWVPCLNPGLAIAHLFLMKSKWTLFILSILNNLISANKIPHLALLRSPMHHLQKRRDTVRVIQPVRGRFQIFPELKLRLTRIAQM